MQQISEAERRRAFAWWLRTGKLAAVRGDDGRELKFNPWHDPDTGRFTFAEGGVFYGRGSSGGGGGSSERTGTVKAEKPEQTGGAGDRHTNDADPAPAHKRAGVPDEVQPDDLLIVAKRQTVHDANSLDKAEFAAFERAADANRWETSDENAAIHDYVRKRERVAARRRIEKAGATDWAKQGKDFAKMYAEEAAWQAAGMGVGKYVLKPLARQLSPRVGRILARGRSPQQIPPATSRPEPPNVKWVDENASMSDDARRYHDSAPGARSNPLTRRSQAPALRRRLPNGKVRYVRFDGAEGEIMVERKLDVFRHKKSKDQFVRQSQALKQNDMQGRLEVPNERVKRDAIRLFKRLNIENITVEVVPNG